MTFTPEAADAVARVEDALGYRFEDRELLRLALVHRSFAAEERREESYERLEFLGDAVLQLTVTEFLYDTYPGLPEGEMAKARAAAVDAATLAAVARRLHVGDALLLGRGEEQTGGREKASILADVTESLIGAVFVEAGYGRARDVIRHHWQELIERRAADPGRRDYKTRLQEELAQRGARPRYVVRDAGPEHAKQFSAEIWDGDVLLGTGTGSSKKRAEQEAARVATEAAGSDGA